MSAPLDPSLPSDKLVAPLNAPRAGSVSPGVQPGVSGQIVLAQYVIIFGTSGGMFIYAGSPALGNPPLYSFGNVTADPYGNPVNPGIWAGAPGQIQVGIQAQGGAAEVFFVPVGTYAADASAGILQTATQAILEIFGARTAAIPAANSDRVGLFLWDHGTSGLPTATADIQAVFFPSSGAGGWLLWDGNYLGLNLPTVRNIQAIQPGTATDPSTTPVPEPWHQATLINGWTASGGVAGVFYRLLPWGPNGTVEIIGDIVHATATGNSTCAQLGTGYQPATAQNHPAAWNDPVVNNSPSIPWVNFQANGNIQITAIEVANKEIFFHVFAPLGAL